MRNRLAVLFLVGLAAEAQMQTQSYSDPGPRGGDPGAGAAISGLSTAEMQFFLAGQSRFLEVDDVAHGLGPRFNATSCCGCHAHPATGGSSPAVNPQVSIAPAGQLAAVASFIKTNGPVREARFIRDLATGAPDGGVHDLFTIVGRPDNPPGCAISQPDFASNLAASNVIFRIPTPTFGAGLIEAIDDATILANKAANADVKASLGIAGHENRSGNDGSITRFGWKAQNKSLQVFTGEAYNVEQGVTNEVFPNEREGDPKCATNGVPEDHTNYDVTNPVQVPSDVVMFMTFMRSLAPPAPVSSYGNVTEASIRNGRALFMTVGCALCHTPTLKTGLSSTTGLSQQPAHLFSDLLVHHMGAGLADGVSQGNAGPDEFRTAPLWGLGQRIFFLHDGKAHDLPAAIRAHGGKDSEARAVTSAFDNLPPGDKQDLLNFLRSL